MENEEIKALVAKIVELEEKNQKMMKSISSSTAVIAALIIINVLVAGYSIFFRH